MSQKTIAEQYQAQYEAAVNDVYRKGDRSKPLLPEGQMEAYLTKIKVKFADALLNIEKQAKQQKKEADALEARAKQDLAHHLTDGELRSFEARRAIVSEDAANMDILDYLRNARAAASSGDKVAALAHLKAMPEPKTIPEGRDIEQVAALLKGVIMPPDLVDAGQRAQQMRYDAEVERVGAKSALHDLVEPNAPYNPFEGL